MKSDRQLEAVTPLQGRRLSSELLRLKELCQQDSVSFHALIDSMTARSHSVLTLVLAIPFLLPIPLPGLSVLFGLFIAIAGLAMAAQKKPWLPRRLMGRDIPAVLMQKIFSGGARISTYLEKLVRPRGQFVLRHLWVRQINGLIIAACGVLLALPLPPGTNFPPATAIILLSMGALEEDVVFMAFGYIAFLLNLAFFTALGILGVQGVRMLLDWQF